MKDSLEDVLNNGYAAWRNNLIIGVPFILDLIASTALLLIALVAGLFVAIVFFAFALSDLADIYSLMLSAVPLAIISVILVALLLTFASAFFESGAIGMALTALRIGRTRLDDMLLYGKKNTVRVFIASLLVGFIIFLALAIGALAIAGAWYILNTYSQLFAWVAVMILSIILLLCMILLTIILSPAKYFIVIEDIGAVKGVKRAYRFSMDNKLSVFVVWLITAVIGILFSVFDFLVGTVLSMLPIAGPLFKFVFSMLLAFFEAAIVYPLLTCWWTRLCMAAAEKKDEPIAPNLEVARPSPAAPSSGQFYV